MSKGKWLFKAFLTFILLGMVTAGATAIQDADVTTTIQEPATDDQIDAGGFLSSGIYTEVDLEVADGTNDSENVDVKYNLSADNRDEYASTTLEDYVDVDNGTTETVDERVTLDYDYPEDYEDATLTVTATYEDTDDTTTASDSDNVAVQVKQSEMFNWIIMLVILTAMLSAFGVTRS